MTYTAKCSRMIRLPLPLPLPSLPLVPLLLPFEAPLAEVLKVAG